MCGPVRTSPGGRVDKIVAAGGMSLQGRTNVVELYDITTNSWQTGVFNLYNVADIKGECGDAQSTSE